MSVIVIIFICRCLFYFRLVAVRIQNRIVLRQMGLDRHQDVLQVCECQPGGNMGLSLDTARAVAKLYDEAYASSRRLFGDDHPETRDNRWRAEGMRKMFQEQGISLEPEAPHPT